MSGKIASRVIWWLTPVLWPENEDDVNIKIKDSGSGIAADQLPFVFDRFYQADSSATRLQEGSGIGLDVTFHLRLKHEFFGACHFNGVFLKMRFPFKKYDFELGPFSVVAFNIDCSMMQLHQFFG